MAPIKVGTPTSPVSTGTSVTPVVTPPPSNYTPPNAATNPPAPDPKTR
jgi:hypothetical protein